MMTKNSQNYFKIALPIILILILIALIIIIKNQDNKSITNLDLNNVEVIVRDSTILDNQDNTIKDSTKSFDNNQLGPATVQDLGGSTKTADIDELLKDKQIELER